MNSARAVVALEVVDRLRRAGLAVGLHEGLELCDGVVELLDDLGGRVHQPDLARAVHVLAGEERDGVVDRLLLGAEVEDVAVGLGVVQHPVGAREGLNQAVVLEVLVDVQGVEVLRVEAGQQHVDDDGDVDLVACAGRRCWGTADP